MQTNNTPQISLIKRIKHYVPKSLFGRFLLIIVTPMILIQLITLNVFYFRHWDNISRHLERALAGEIALTVNMSQHLSSEQLSDAITLAERYMEFSVVFVKNQTLPDTPRNELTHYPNFTNKLDAAINSNYHLYTSGPRHDITVDVQYPNGILRITASKKRLASPTTYIFVMWMVGAALILVIIAIIFMRNQIKPMARLAKAAEAFGKGQEITEFKAEGANEIRKVSEAFIDMKERIDRQVKQRTEMLAGVSHDLKTPLTRIKLQLALMNQSKEKEELEHDIHEMETMIQGYLDFAKGRGRAISEQINVSDQIRSIIAGYRKHHGKIDLKLKSGLYLTINPNCFRRIISNLLDNALRYAKNITVQSAQTERYIIIMIDDDGPGIPSSKQEHVFKPFYRIDSSRNQETGGVGLGLSVTKDLVMLYGGEIYLDQSPENGLRVIVKLPL